MTDQQQPPTEAAPDAPAPSRIVITFGGRGMADHRLELEGVTGGQVMAAALFLDEYARRMIQPPPALPGRGIVLADRLPPRKGH